MIKTTENNGINFNFIPSLEQLSCATIIVALWKQKEVQDDVINSLQLYPDKIECDHLETVEKQLTKIISHLPLTKPVILKLLEVVRPIGKEIIAWVQYHTNYVFKDTDKSKVTSLINGLVWTTKGRINYEQTAKVLLNDNVLLKYEEKFKLACNYCMENEILDIASSKVNIDGNVNGDDSNEQNLEQFWTSCLTGNNSIDQNTFSSLLGQYSGCHLGNPVAIKYIWGKIPDIQKVNFVIEAVKATWSLDTVCFMLSQMNEEQQQEVFKLFSIAILKFLFEDWIIGNLFFATLDGMWKYINGEKYLGLLTVLAYEIEKNNSKSSAGNYNNSRTLRCMWEYAPEHFRKFCVDFKGNSKAFCLFVVFPLIKLENMSLVFQLLKDVSKGQKKKVLCSPHGIDRCKKLLCDNQWTLLDILIDQFLERDENDSKFRNLLMDVEGFRLCLDFYRKDELSKVDELMKVLLKSDEERTIAKQKLLSQVEQSVLSTN